MDIRFLETFVMVASCASIAAATRRLHVTQAAESPWRTITYRRVDCGSAPPPPN